MSYRRTFTRTISIHYSGSVRYPASQSGGSVSYSGTAHETVQVNIDVDTDPFDNSIRHCQEGVGLLTGSVVATEAAQVKSIADNAQRVGSTIVNGFFKTVRSELSQQIAELNSGIEATLIHLRAMAKRCVDKQRQMATDYQRITSRYSKIFADLNQELENRIYSLDEPTFRFRRQADALQSGTNESTGASTVAVAGAEGSSLHARITASVAKREALGAIHRANAFLSQQQSVDRLLRHCLLADSADGQRFAPVAYMESTTADGAADSVTAASVPLQRVPSRSLAERMRSLRWRDAVSTDSSRRIRDYYNRAVAAEIPADSAHNDRVRQYMGRLFDLSHTAAPSSL